MAYLYRHIRLDKQEVFYIGIGSDDEGKYKRAYNKRYRNYYWHNIAKKGYEVEIVLDNLTWEEACEKEKEFIKLYGRKDLNEGTLVNMTDGGEGILGFKHSKESILKTIQSDGFKNRKVSQEHKKGKSYEDLYGEVKAKEIKQKQSSAKRPEPKKGKEHHHFGKKRPEHSKKLKELYSQGILKASNLFKDSNPMKREDIRKKVSDSKKGVQRQKLTCPHCNKVGGPGNMQRWHFNNCKANPQVIASL